jgi:hypothetical protein
MQAEKDSAVKDLLKGIQGPGQVITANGGAQATNRSPPQADIDALESAARKHIPLNHAPITGARFGLDNSIWVKLRQTGSNVQWVMMNDRGDPALTVTLPPKTNLMQASRTTIWTMQLDGDDVPSVVRYRIDR